MKKVTAGLLLTISSILWVVVGIGLLVFPEYFADRLGAGGQGTVVVSLWGAGSFGFGAMNWIVRNSLVGGIYGRAVVILNTLLFGYLLLRAPR